jgi:hypothetical protein
MIVIEEKKQEIIEQVYEKIQELLARLANLPEFPPNLFPFLPFDFDFFGFLPFDFDFDFGFPWFDFSFFFDLSFIPPGLIAVLIEFFENLPNTILEIITAIVQAIASLSVLIDLLKQGISALIEFIVGFVVEPILMLIKSAWESLTEYTIPLAAFMVIVDKIVPMLIVGVTGYLIGPGLITKTMASNFGLLPN